MSYRIVHKLFLTVLVITRANIAIAESKTWLVKPDQSPVSFLAVGKPGFLKINGEGTQLSGNADWVDGRITGGFTVDLTSLKTGIDMRDQHMKEKYLDTKSFPKAELTLNPTPLTLKEVKSDQAFSGILTIKGVAKPIQGTMQLTGLDTKQVKGRAQFEIKMSDYPIGVPSHLGVSVAEIVRVSVDIVADLITEGGKK